MKILFVSSQALFKNTRFGGAKRLYYMARELDSRADLHLICLDGGSEIVDPATHLSEFKNICLVPSSPIESLREKIPFLSEAAKALKAHQPALVEFLKGKHFDAVLMAYPGALRFMETGLISWPKNVVYLEDDLLIELMKTPLAPGRPLSSRLWSLFRYWQAKLFYAKVLRRVSRFVCISPQEERVVQKRWPHAPTSLLSYGIPLEEYPRLSVPPRPNVLGFIGNYRHTPNADAARWLIETLFPAVLVRIPGAQLLLCGVGFPEELRALCADNGSIRIMDNVAELSTFYESISVFVNAVRTGRGMRTKVIEAAAFGRPVLSTRLGAEGLEELGLGLFETGEELAHLLGSMNDTEAVARTLDQNRAIVERDFSMNTVGRQLMALLAPA